MLENLKNAITDYEDDGNSSKHVHVGIFEV